MSFFPSLASRWGWHRAAAVCVGNHMNIERTIRQFRETSGTVQQQLYGDVAMEIQRRLPQLRQLANVGLSPIGRERLREHEDGDLVSRLLERVVEVPEPGYADGLRPTRRRRKAYEPIDGKFDSYASDHIRRFIKEQMKQQWIPLEAAPEIRAQLDHAPTNTLSMEEIHGVIKANVMQAMDSAAKVDAKTKILLAIDQMPPDSVSPAIFDELCRKAGLLRHEKARIIQLTSERPDKYERQVEEILRISQSAARRRVDRAVPHLLAPLQKALAEARRNLKQRVEPQLDPDRDPFLAE